MGNLARAARAVCILAMVAWACTKHPTSPTPAVVASAGHDLTSSLSASFDALTIPGNAGCSISVSRQGEVVLERARGQIAPGRPASVDSPYRIASLTKPITASAILVSEQAGRLSRNDKVNRFLAYPEPAPTLDELAKHIPGLPNYLDTPEYQVGRTSPTTVETLLSLIQPWDGIRRFQYSNSHAILLGAVLQQVNGLPYEQVIQRDIFGPAGMSRSSVALPPASESFPFPATHSSWVYSAGGVTSTVGDMNRFNQALLSNRFGFGAVESFDRSAAGVTSFGMGSAAGGGDLRFTHAGGLDNYSSFSIMFPADRSSIVVLCNFNNNNPDSLFNFVTGIRSIMLGSI